MTDISALKSVIEDSGMTMVAIAKKAGMVRETLYNRLNGIGEFTASEIIGLSEALHLKNADRERIFFTRRVE